MVTPSKQMALPVMEAEDLECLTKAHHCLEHPSFAARLTNVVGTPIDIALHLLPKGWYRRLHGATEGAIRKAERSGKRPIAGGRITTSDKGDEPGNDPNCCGR